MSFQSTLTGALGATWGARLSADARLRAVTAAGLGGLAATAMPPAGAFPVLFLAIPGLIALLDAAPTRRGAFLVGWSFGFGFHLIGLYWISFALFTDIGRFWWALPFSAAGLPILLGCFSGLAGVGYRSLAPFGRGPRRGGWLRPIAFAAAWSAAEALRSLAFTGFPWNLPGQTWTGPWIAVFPVAQLASVVGIQGLSLLTVLAAAMPIVLFDRGVPRARAIAAVAATGILIVAAAVWGAWRLAGGPDPEVPGVRLRLVQPNIPQTLKWAPEARRANFVTHLELTARPADIPPTIVIWAETATPFFLEREATARSMIAHSLPPGAVLLTGSPRPAIPAEEGGPPLYHNGMLAIDGGGAVIATYDKFHLVPFGEYMPFRSWLPVGAIAGNGGEYAPGPGPRTIRVPGAPPFGPLICYEAIFPDAVVERDDPPAWLLNLTNDGWYGHSAGPHQHLAIAATRAIEEGVPMVRVANTGVSAVIDAHGRIVAELPLGAAGVLDSGLPAPLVVPTIFARWGQVPFWTTLTLLLASCISLRRNYLCR